MVKNLKVGFYEIIIFFVILAGILLFVFPNFFNYQKNLFLFVLFFALVSTIWHIYLIKAKNIAQTEIGPINLENQPNLRIFFIFLELALLVFLILAIIYVIFDPFQILFIRFGADSLGGVGFL
ncbi:MAG: hypothetical protein Q7S21_06465 [archaeon]|nr:hypothetical protein [archaeon]